jgi:hypothetical protein
MKKSYDDIVRELADLDVNYLNLHRAWRKEQADRIRMENALKKIAESGEDSSCNELALKYEVIAEKALNNS